MGRTKLGYVVNFGLRPYLHGLLTESIKKSLYYFISFDESLNDSFQNCQMDLNIRFWNNRVESRHFDSQFLGHPTAKNLLESMILKVWQRLIVLILHNCLWTAQVWTGYSLIFLKTSANNKSYLSCSTLGVTTFM